MLSKLVPLILQNITNYIMMFYIIHKLTSHLNFLSTQTASQPIQWQQLNAFRHIDIVKMTS